MTISHAQNTRNKSLAFSAGGRTRKVTGQVAKALTALVNAGSRGITALEVSGWAYRLGAYVYTLRHEHDLTIITIREEHEGGYHARYVLKSHVTLSN